MNKCLIALLTLFLSTLAVADSLSSPAQMVKESKQLILVIATDFDTVNGKIIRFQRKSAAHKWNNVGEALPVVVGKKGMAWGAGFFQEGDGSGPIKVEGDGRTPIGVFKIGPAFGFDAKPDPNMKMDYLPLLKSSVCVDDAKSRYYNMIIDSAKLGDKDWDSAEMMRDVPFYSIGSMIQFNANQSLANAGSCIFMHIWRGPNQGTAGCVAMDENELRQLITWLDPHQKPVIVIVSAPVYAHVKAKWHLPPQVKLAS